MYNLGTKGRDNEKKYLILLFFFNCKELGTEEIKLGVLKPRRGIMLCYVNEQVIDS